MHPEMSLVFLTVLAAAGQGIFLMVVVFDTFFVRTGAVSPEFITTGTLFALFFQFAGMIASTLHLGNAQKGYKAILKWKNSWLTREILTLSTFVGLAVLYLVMHHMEATDSHRLFIAFFAVVASIAFLISCSMVYASISFVKEWANVTTPINFTMLGITSGVAYGSILLYLTRGEYDITAIMSGVNIAILILASLSLILKYITNLSISNSYIPVGMKNATGINDPAIKLIDMGTSYSHYNTKEYYYPITKSELKNQRRIMYMTVFFVPLIIWGYTYIYPNAFLNFIAAHVMLVGLFFERRLFFIQGNHVQNLYYDTFRSSNAKNPLVTEACKGSSAAH